MRGIPMNERHDAFIGRWVVFHNGHMEMIRKVYNKNKRPILILIMDTRDEFPEPYDRLINISNILESQNIPHKCVIIPPIASINWGRAVGYETNYIEVNEEIQKISGTKIREKINNGDESWKNDIPI